jgi:two-component system, NtrC family, nitrogen regulation response regulator NtrX
VLESEGGFKMPRILLVEDHDDARIGIEHHLSHNGYQVEAVASRNRAISQIQARPFDAILIDLRLPTEDGSSDESETHGLTVIESARKHSPNAWIAVITGYGSVGNAHRAWRLGVDDFLDKPIELDDLLTRLQKAIDVRQLSEDAPEFYQWPPPPPPQLNDKPTIIGGTQAMKELFNQIQSVAASGSNVILLTGETGTGKEVWAEAIHQLSSRRGKPYVPVNCTGITETLAESSLFGVEDRAVPEVNQQEGYFRQAAGGTLLLDEFGELSSKIQPKLLRALENGEIQPIGTSMPQHVDVRVILATNRNLDEAIETGDFRADLFFRAGPRIHIPPLRDHKEDIPHLVNHFIRQYIKKIGRDPDDPKAFPLKISGTVWELLYDQEWPGNIRQLRKVIENALTHLPGTVLSPGELLKSFLQTEVTQTKASTPQENEPPTSSALPNEPEKALYESFKRLVELGNDWNTITDYLVVAAMAERHVDAQAAALIGMPPGTLRDKKGPIIRDLKELLRKQGTSEEEIEKLAEQLGNLRPPEQRRRLLEKFPINTEPR